MTLKSNHFNTTLIFTGLRTKRNNWLLRNEARWYELFQNFHTNLSALKKFRMNNLKNYTCRLCQIKIINRATAIWQKKIDQKLVRAMVIKKLKHEFHFVVISQESFNCYGAQCNNFPLVTVFFWFHYFDFRFTSDYWLWIDRWNSIGQFLHDLIIRLFRFSYFVV